MSNSVLHLQFVGSTSTDFLFILVWFFETHRGILFTFDRSVWFVSFPAFACLTEFQYPIIDLNFSWKWSTISQFDFDPYACQ